MVQGFHRTAAIFRVYQSLNRGVFFTPDKLPDPQIIDY